MARFFLIFSLVMVTVGTPWIYRTFFRPIDPLTSEVLALAQHFQKGGLNVRPYAVRHGLPHTMVKAAAAFEIIGFPLPISVDECPTTAAAVQHFATVAVSPNLTHPMRNGDLVMYLPMWGSDADPEARRVSELFRSFSYGT